MTACVQCRGASWLRRSADISLGRPLRTGGDKKRLCVVKTVNGKKSCGRGERGRRGVQETRSIDATRERHRLRADRHLCGQSDLLCDALCCLQAGCNSQEGLVVNLFKEPSSDDSEEGCLERLDIGSGERLRWVGAAGRVGRAMGACS